MEVHIFSNIYKLNDFSVSFLYVRMYYTETDILLNYWKECPHAALMHPGTWMDSLGGDLHEWMSSYMALSSFTIALINHKRSFSKVIVIN